MNQSHALDKGPKALTLHQTKNIIDWPKFKAFSDDRLITIQKLKCVQGRVENIVGR